MIKTMQGNILDIPNIYICHQVSHEKITISDLTQQIKEKWPEAYNDYRTLCIYENNLLGSTNFFNINETTFTWRSCCCSWGFTCRT